MGHTPTIMDYSRFNYVAQPEDEHRVGGSRSRRSGRTTSGRPCGATQPIPGAKTPDDEKQTLDEWAREQDQNAVAALLDRRQRTASDPGEQTEAVGDADAVQATTLGLKNLERVADMLLPATAKPGEPYDDLERALRPAARPVGARDEPRRRRSSAASTRSRSTAARRACASRRSPKARQQAAVQFLQRATPSRRRRSCVKPDILRRIEPAGVARSHAHGAAARARPRCSRAPALLRLVEQRGARRRRRLRADRLPRRRARAASGASSPAASGARSTPSAATCSGPTSRRWPSASTAGRRRRTTPARSSARSCGSPTGRCAAPPSRPPMA